MLCCARKLIQFPVARNQIALESGDCVRMHTICTLLRYQHLHENQHRSETWLFHEVVKCWTRVDDPIREAITPHHMGRPGAAVLLHILYLHLHIIILFSPPTGSPKQN